jgi:phosphoserine phosphatase
MPIELREPGWSPSNRDRLERALEDLAARKGRRVAVFDWDNTMIRGDNGDLVLAHLLERDALACPDPSRLALLTSEGRAALARGGREAARAIAHLAWNGTTPEGAPGFTIPIAPRYRATYGFLAQVLAGRTDEELREITREVWLAASRAEIGARGEVHGVEVERFARLHRPMIELGRALERAGVEVWVVSASLQPIVEVLAELAGRGWSTTPRGVRRRGSRRAARPTTPRR